MEFPSVTQLWQSFLAVCKRFGIPILYAFFATVAALLLSYKSGFENEQILGKLIYLGNFGLALSIAFSLYAETNPASFTKKTIANLAILLILVLIYVTLQPAIRQADVFILLALGFACHLLVSFSAFAGNDKEVGFWQINKVFFLRFATSILYSTVLFIGLSIALLSIKTLFNIRWDGDIYIRLWIIIVGLFNTVFFLAGIPAPLNALNEENNYPKTLKVFTQYVLIPLASIYLMILLAYEVKIILQWSLPTSSVAILILGYAVFGILSILLVHPVRNNEGNKWIQLYSKSFYILMVPLLLLLAVAICKRISDYGITESRYLLIALSLWLAFITIYFLIKGREHIRIIPISLFVFSLLIVIGPWNMRSVSLRSQSTRLATYLKQKSSYKRDEEIRNLVRHLNNNYGSQSLQNFVKIDLQSIESQKRKKIVGKEVAQWSVQREIADTVLKSLNISAVSRAQVLDEQQKNYINAEEGRFSVKGASQVIEVGSIFAAGSNKKIDFAVDGSSFSLVIDAADNLVLSDAKNTKVVFNVSEILKSLYHNKSLKISANVPSKHTVPNDRLIITHRFHNYTFKLRLEELSAYYPEKERVPPINIYFNGYLIVYPNL
ncbi:DUF4153 domain-containing protein [Pedobacter arcticus]|uniref:DUF4153 domain-containing protein n=1 Tax=Pedobacter arcticus TaxID=752140 RepID=UPI0002FFD649|nr:DUF4153 domain-containing protein [Pedobacter arcticus]